MVGIQNIQNDLQKNAKNSFKKNGNDIENRDARSPSAEAGLHERTTEKTFNKTMNIGSPERRINTNYSKVESLPDMAREQNNEKLASSSKNNFFEDESEEQIKSDSEKADIKFTTPDEFYLSQDPSPKCEDITLGRNISSATKISTAKAAPISSEVSKDA
jgi:hypothetical protein